MGDLRRDDVPPPAGPEAEIVRIKSANPHWFVILSASLWGVWTHWNGKRSEPCTGDTKLVCEGHKREYPLRWKGYLYCYSHEHRKHVFLELTPVAAQSILDQLPTGENLRAYRLEMKRSSDAKGSRLKATVHPPLRKPDELPKAEDPERHLWKLWNSARGIDSSEKKG